MDDHAGTKGRSVMSLQSASVDSLRDAARAAHRRNEITWIEDEGEEIAAVVPLQLAHAAELLEQFVQAGARAAQAMLKVQYENVRGQLHNHPTDDGGYEQHSHGGGSRPHVHNEAGFQVAIGDV